MPYLINLVLFFALFDPEVTFLVGQMGDEEWAVREEASAALVKMDERPIKLLRIAQDPKNNPDLEIRRRANKIVRKYEGSIEPSNNENFPWIDHLPDDFVDRDLIIKRFIRPYRSQFRYDNHEYQIFRDATKDFILEYSRRGHTRQECIRLLDLMVENQKTWVASQHPNYFYKTLPDDD